MLALDALDSLDFGVQTMAQPGQQGTEVSLDIRERLSRLLRRAIDSYATMSSALEIARRSPAFSRLLYRDHMSGASGLHAMLQQTQIIKGYEAEKDLPVIAENLAKLAAVNGNMVIAGAVVVLSHATADDVFTAGCQIAIDLAPGDWIIELQKKRTVTLGELRERGTDRVFADELDRFKQQLADKSLPNRAELLFRHVPIAQTSQYQKSTDPQFFRLTKLKEIDDLRHDIMHRNGLSRTNLNEGADAMSFLHEAAITVVRSLVTHYRVPLISELISGARD